MVEGRIAQELPQTSVFGSVKEASDFFEKGSLGYSVTPEAGKYDGLDLRSFNWQVQPLTLEKVESSFFENTALFPTGSVEFDCALLMRGIEHEWHGRESLCVGCFPNQPIIASSTSCPQPSVVDLGGVEAGSIPSIPCSPPLSDVPVLPR